MTKTAATKKTETKSAAPTKAAAKKAPAATSVKAAVPAAEAAGKKKVVKATQAKAKASTPKAVSKTATSNKKKAAPKNAGITRPTRSRTAYMMFVRSIRTKTQTDNPNMSFVDVTKEVANRWQALSGRERKPFEDQAAKDKIRYDGEVKAFRESYPDEPLTIKKKKRVAKVKGPKKARSAYVFYTIEKRPELKAKHADLDFGQLTQRVADGWNQLSEAQKAPYEAQAAADKTRFDGENKDFNEAHPEVARRRKKARKNAPKKARSAYLYYTQEVRPTVSAANPGIGFGELTKLVAAQWAKLSDAQKKKYEKQATDDKKRYDTEMEGYVPPTEEELDAEEGKRKRKSPEGPTRPRTSYVYFTMDQRSKIQSEHPEMKFGEITKLLAEEWRGLNENQKGKYVEQAEADKTRYTNEVAAAGN